MTIDDITYKRPPRAVYLGAVVFERRLDDETFACKIFFNKKGYERERERERKSSL